MQGRNPRSTAQIAGHPIHPMLVPFPIVGFVGTLVADIVFISNGDFGWATASKWLLGLGLLGAALAATAGLIDYMGDDRIRRLGPALRHMIANVTVVVIEVINLFMRLSDEESIASVGIILSAVAVLILLYSGWQGGELVFRHRVGVQDGADQSAGYDETRPGETARR